MNKIFIAFSLLYIGSVQAQVGIGTTTPDASSVLDITSADKGILIPRVTLLDVSDDTLPIDTPAEGLLVWNDNAGVTGGNGVGFYYFNGTIWERLTTTAGDDIDWYEEGTTTSPNDITDDMFTQGNVAIGKNTADYRLDINETTGTRGVNTSISSSIDDPIYGNYISNSNTGSGVHYGSYNSLTGTGIGEQYGVYNAISNTGDDDHWGSFNLLDGTGNGSQYGIQNEIINSGSGTHYGISSKISNSGGGTHYGFSSEISGNGNGTKYGYASYNNSVGNNQHYGMYNILTGAGPGIQYGVRNSISNTGNNIHYGVLNSLSATGDGDQYGVKNSIGNSGSGNHYGSYNQIYGAGVGPQYGTYNEISNTDGTLLFGTYNDISGTNPNSIEGTTNYITNNGDGTHYGSFNELDGTGNGDQYGARNNIGNTGNGTHYGVYNNLSSSGTGNKFGTVNSVSSTSNSDVYGTLNGLGGGGTGIHYGTLNQLGGFGDGTQMGYSQEILNSGNGYHYGAKNYLAGTGSGNKYGMHNLIANTAGGTHYGIYSEVLKAGSYAGYFLGNVSIGTTGANNYTLPASRGLNGQVLQTNGTGNVSWVDTSTIGDDLGNHGATTTLDLNSQNITEVSHLSTLPTSNYDKLRVYNNSINTIGIHDAMTYGFLNNWAMTFTINNIASQGWIWRDINDAQSDGAMSLTTLGQMTLKSDLRVDTSTLTVDATNNRVGIGTTAPVDRLEVNGGRVEFTATTDATGTAGSGVLEIGNRLRFDNGEIITNTGTPLLLQYDNEGDLIVDNYTFAVDASANRVMIGGNLLPGRVLDVNGRMRIRRNGATSGIWYADGANERQFAGVQTHSGTGTSQKWGVYNNGSWRFIVQGNGRIGIRTTAPEFDLNIKQSSNTAGGVGGLGLTSSSSANDWKIYHGGTDLTIAENGVQRGRFSTGTGQYFSGSDIKLKTNINLIKSVLSKLIDLPAYSFRYKNQTKRDKKTLGFMAQDVQPLFPELVSEGEDGYLGLNYAGFGVLAIKAIQEQQSEIEDLKQQLESQQKEIDAIKALLKK